MKNHKDKYSLFIQELYDNSQLGHIVNNCLNKKEVKKKYKNCVFIKFDTFKEILNKFK